MERHPHVTRLIAHRGQFDQWVLVVLLAENGALAFGRHNESCLRQRVPHEAFVGAVEVEQHSRRTTGAASDTRVDDGEGALLFCRQEHGLVAHGDLPGEVADGHQRSTARGDRPKDRPRRRLIGV